jgi:hypothetical protein
MLKAQRFRDDDYAQAICHFLTEVFDSDSEVGHWLVLKIVEHKNDYIKPLSNEAKVELDQILQVFRKQAVALSNLLDDKNNSLSRQLLPQPILNQATYRLILKTMH